jgi:Putative lumazine-binding
VLDYFEGWFDADVERMDRALHTDLVKRWPGTEGAIALPILTKARMLELTAEGEGRADGVDRRVDIRIEDVSEGIANVTVDTPVYREYLQLVLTPDGWKIANTLWRPQ